MMRYFYENGNEIGSGYGMMGGSGFVMMFFGLILTGIIVYAVYKILKRDPLKNYQENESINILNLRFAKGEINQEEYKLKKALLTK
jgi:putative membrane protein